VRGRKGLLALAILVVIVCAMPVALDRCQECRRQQAMERYIADEMAGRTMDLANEMQALKGQAQVVEPRPEERVGGWSVRLNYDEVVWWSVPCYPDEWQSQVDFELRTVYGGWVAEQMVSTDCKIVCNPEGVSCEGIATPSQWDVHDGRYQVWFRGRWVNEVRGLNVVSHPAALKPYEDGRQFLYLETVWILFHRLYLPIIWDG
jgi:hypothetical protein